jgi:hypothetical protein
LGNHEATGASDVRCSIVTIPPHAGQNDQHAMIAFDQCRRPGQRVDGRHAAVDRLPLAQNGLQKPAPTPLNLYVMFRGGEPYLAATNDRPMPGNTHSD